MAAGNGGGGTMAPATGRISAGTTSVPCNVAQALQRSCGSCHAATPIGTTPMALITHEDFHLPAISNSALQVHQVALTRLHDTFAPMPPPPSVISADDKATIDAWLTGGAVAGEACGGGGAGGMAGGTGGGGGGSGGSTEEMPDDLGECHDLLAHAPGSTSPYSLDREHYVNFYFDAPWPAGTHGISFETVFGEQPAILHHWLLYIAAPVGAFPIPPPFGPPPLQPHGTVESNTNGSHSGATLIAGWAPGGDNGKFFPREVGMDIDGETRKLVMEIHYFPNGATTDASGVRVCTSKAKRANTATVSWLGTETINVGAGQMVDVSGTCSPGANAPIHIIRTWPHMHRIGRHMKTILNRADGTKVPLVDQPFNFDLQIAYDADMIVMPGETLTTTCTYHNDTAGNVTYGTSTTNEMCFNFVTAWPAGALTSGRAMNGAQNPCM